MLLDSWIIQQQYAGEPYRFTSDEFISLLDRTKKLFARLAKEEPLTQKKQKKLRELFTNPGVTYDGGKANCSRELYNWDHMIPYRVYASQPPLINIETGFVCTGNSNADPAEVNRYMEEIVRRRDWHRDTVYATYTHPEMMDPEKVNKTFFSRFKDGYMAQQWLDSVQRIQGVADGPLRLIGTETDAFPAVDALDGIDDGVSIPDTDSFGRAAPQAMGAALALFPIQ